MKLGKCSASNLGSYKNLEFDFSNQGLALISGEIGSGKSTLLDVPCYILFGETSKGGKVDEIRTWGSEEPTVGELQIFLSDNAAIIVTRTRGSVNQNDLYFQYEGSDDLIRGKDITDTQKKLNQLLGFDSGLYFTAAYFHQFSDAGSFFTARANDRRDVLEKIADQEIAIKLADRSSEARKLVKKELAQKEIEKAKLDGSLQQLKSALAKLQSYLRSWDIDQRSKIDNVKRQFNEFDQSKQKAINHITGKIGSLESQIVKIVESPEELKKCLDSLRLLEKRKSELQTTAMSIELNLENHVKELETLDNHKTKKCPTCQSDLSQNPLAARKAHLSDTIEKYSKLLEETYKLQKVNDDKLALKPEFEEKLKITALNAMNLTLLTNSVRELTQVQETKNVYGEQLKVLESETNPHMSGLDSTLANIRSYEQSLTGVNQEIKELTNKISSLSWLYDHSFVLRGIILEQSVKQLETATNNYLEKYFDAEIRVIFTLENTDKIEISVQKGGHSCTYRQLSGGQRCILKLCFWIALMSAAENKAGIKFNTLSFDESLHALNETLKIKAFRLFQDLESRYNSVFVIDHSEGLKDMFENQFHVTISGDQSEISKIC